MSDQDDSMLLLQTENWFQRTMKWQRASLDLEKALTHCVNQCGGCRNDEAFDEQGRHITPAGPQPCHAPGAKHALVAFEAVKQEVLHSG